MVAIQHTNLAATRRQHRHGRRDKFDTEKLGACVLVSLGIAYVGWALLWSSTNENHNQNQPVPLATNSLDIDSVVTYEQHPQVRFEQENPVDAEAYNAVALDIITLLKCKDKLKKRDRPQRAREFAEDADAEARWRRLEEENGERDGKVPENDFVDDFVLDDDYLSVTAAQLFCLAALSSNTASQQDLEPWYKKVHCNVRHKTQDLLELWSAARLELDEDVLVKILNASTEQERTLVGNPLHVWSPKADNGVEYMLSVLNNDEKKNVNHGGLYGLSLGQGKLWVDVGSCLGLSSMAVALLYPGTRIVSIEAAAPNWLLQKLNWSCNNAVSNAHPQILLTGVGPTQHGGKKIAKYLWRPHATTATRSWTKREEREDGDVELRVALQPWHDILQIAGIASSSNIDVLNVDCEGCEYNMIPAMEDEFDAIATVTGAIHFGYISEAKLPSSQRAAKTHKKLCQHESFARAAKECCAFSDMAVRSTYPDEVLVQDKSDGGFPPKHGTVADVAGDLCDDFETWAMKKKLYTVDNDWGWMQLTSMAD